MWKAYEDCMKNKKNTQSAIDFSVNDVENILRLCDEVNSHTYQIGKSITFVIKHPVYREIFAADFRDRIIHHLVINELMTYFDDEFIDESFSCRPGKGVLHGVETMFNHIKNCTENYTKDAWILKLDARAFFMSIDKQLLVDMVDDLIVRRYPENRKKETLRWLCRLIIMHRPQDNCERCGDLSLWNLLPSHKSLFSLPEGKGLAIGNLTSQVFANFYMSPLDTYIKYTLGFTHYGRYVDDFIIISTDKEKLKTSIPFICKFAKENLLIDIHPDKRYLQHYRNGVKFIGSVLKENRIYVSNRTVDTLKTKLTTTFKEYKPELLNEFMTCMNSYLGYMGHYNSFNIRRKILTDMKLIGEWLPYIRIDYKNYRKITIRRNNTYNNF